MSRKLYAIGLVALTLGLYGCGEITNPLAEVEHQQTHVEDTSVVVDEDTASEESPAIEQNTDTEENVVSYLTGLDTTVELRNQRPLAVMLNNIKEGCPQSGTSQASIIYEVPVEGRITRLMGIFEDYANVPKIGSIRSCRDYFVFLANEYDCIYAHFGQATPYVGDYLNSDAVDNISGAVSGIDRPANNTFYRTTDRKAPHNVYIDPEGLLKDIERFEYRTKHKDDFVPKFIFFDDAKESTAGALDAKVLYPGGKETGKGNGFSNVQSTFVYDEATSKYLRYQYGEPHIDELTGEQLAFDNVIFQYCHGEVRDDHDYLSFGIHGENGYRVQIFTQGKMINGTWKRDANNSPAVYSYDSGVQIPIAKGKTWICIIWDEYAEDVVIE